jgi:hypothetical protein
MTIDSFLLLAPVLLLAIMALVRFIGCQLFLDFTPDQPASAPPAVTPMEITAVAFIGSAVACGTARVRATGTSFVNGARLQWNGVALPTQFVSTTELQADVTFNDMSITSADVVVVKPSGETSTAFHFVFTVTPGALRVALAQETGLPSGPEIGPVTTIKDLEFGSGQWVWWRDATDVFDLHFSSPGTVRTFSFRNGAAAILDSMTVRNFAASPNAMTVSDDAGQSVSLSLPALAEPIQSVVLTTAWKRCSTSITVRLQTASNEVGIVDISYRLPA